MQKKEGENSMKFKGTYRSCRKYEHKVADCPDEKNFGQRNSDARKNNNNSNNTQHRFTGKCFYCGKCCHRV